MEKLAHEITEKPIIGNAALAAMGERMCVSDSASICARRKSLIESGVIGLQKAMRRWSVPAYWA